MTKPERQPIAIDLADDTVCLATLPHGRTQFLLTADELRLLSTITAEGCLNVLLRKR